MKKEWFFPDAYLPDTSDGISHESLCVLNVNDEDASFYFMFYYEDKEPMLAYEYKLEGNRDIHIRLDKVVLINGKKVERCIPYGIRLVSDIPVLCQYTRVDASKPSYSLMTTMGC